MTKEEQVVWDRIEEFEAAIAELEGMLAKIQAIRITSLSKKSSLSTSPPTLACARCL